MGGHSSCVCCSLQHGIFRFARVCILGNNCANWYCTALGAILAGLVLDTTCVLQAFSGSVLACCVLPWQLQGGDHGDFPR